jgi:hypothetical protein
LELAQGRALMLKAATVEPARSNRLCSTSNQQLRFELSRLRAKWRLSPTSPPAFASPQENYDSAIFHFQQLMERSPTHYVALVNLIQASRIGWGR